MPITVIHQIMPDNTKLMSAHIVVIFPHKYVKFLTIFVPVLALYHKGFFKDFCIFVRGVYHFHYAQVNLLPYVPTKRLMVQFF